MLKFIGALTLSVSGIIFRGWALATLWAWFIVSIFPVLPKLSIPAAMGLCLVVRYVTNEAQPDFDKRTPEESRIRYIQSVALTFAQPLIALAVGRILLLFI